MNWSAIFAAKTFGVFVTPFVIGPIIYFLASALMKVEPPFSGVYLLVMPAMLFAVYLVITAALYFYIALAGGIMSRTERERKQNSLPR